ncbi:MAG: TetR/AcrR family transcriptional regulator [Solirubrobacteraceae bacterium]
MATSNRETTPEAAPSGRRARLREWTREEIKTVALGQLAEHGVEGLSLNAIAKELGMTGPALYRYVASRDELLADLVVDAWEELADAVERAVEENAEASAARRLGAIGLAYRSWGTTQPHRYRLAMQTRLGSGELAPERVIPAAQRAMAVILDAIGGLPKSRKPTPELPAGLRAELETWTKRVGGRVRPPAVLLGGVIFWSRLHGMLSLELDGHLASMQLDAELLYRSELAALGGRDLESPEGGPAAPAKAHG